MSWIPARATRIGRDRGAALAVLGLALLTLTGCPKREIGPVPRTVEEAVDRVNANLSQIDAPLYCKDASVTFSFRDAEGRTRRFVGHPATIIFQPQRDLYFDIKASLTRESVARVGSNLDRYWFWVDVADTRTLWYGAWAALRSDPPRSLPLPPNDLLDALMVRPLPRALAGGIGPLLRVDGKDQRLIYPRLDEQGDRVGYREIRLDPYLPQQPAEIIDRDRHGGVLMHAWLSNYERVATTDGKPGPWTARKYRVQWPVTGATMDLSIGSAKFRPDQPQEFKDFPSDWQGQVENLDEIPADDEPPL